MTNRIDQSISEAEKQADDAVKLLDTMWQYRRRKDATPIIEAVVKGFEYDPGHSDLDDEQPIHVQMTLGDWRKARRLLHEIEDEQRRSNDELYQNELQRRSGR